jgi:hypothetical protein
LLIDYRQKIKYQLQPGLVIIEEIFSFLFMISFC